jgi:hypothetical protein
MPDIESHGLEIAVHPAQCTEFAAARANCPVEKNEKLIPKLQVTETGGDRSDDLPRA